MAWNVFKIDSSKIGFYQNFLIYCDKFDNKIIYCLSRFRTGNFSPAPTSTIGSPAAPFILWGKLNQSSLLNKSILKNMIAAVIMITFVAN